MDHQTQLGLGWLLAPSGGSNSNILFSNAEHHGITTVTTVPASMMMTVENNKILNGSVQRYQQQLHHHQQQIQCSSGGIVGDPGTGPINYEIISKNLCQHNNNQIAAPVPPPSSVSSVAEGAQKFSVTRTKGSNQMKSTNKSLLDADELAKRREINRLREKRRRDQMTPKERAKARKKNRIRARKRRKNMTAEEREEEKEKNRERARQRRAHKIQSKN